MPKTPQFEIIISRLRRSVLHEQVDLDADLLDRYASQRDEAAFEALVRRHGPMVMGVCRRVLRGEADAEDAFQATFLILARKAALVRHRDAVNNWLYGVAYNVARRARTISNQRRRVKEQAAGAMALPYAPDNLSRQVESLIDDELNRLPDKYRVPIVSCGLEGKTIQETAVALGWPSGTVATRLARGRVLLARRLARHGVVVPAALLASTASPGMATAFVPNSLLEATVRLVSETGSVPAAILTLTTEVTRIMLLSKIKVVATVLMATLIGTGVVLSQTTKPEPVKSSPVDPAVKKADPAEGEGKATKSIEGTYVLSGWGDTTCAPITRIVITAREGDGFSVRGSGQAWSGEGRVDGDRGYYNWVFANGDRGKTILTINLDGTLKGEVRGEIDPWTFLARRVKAAEQ